MNHFTIESGKASFNRTALFIAQCSFVSILVTVFIGGLGIVALGCINAIYTFYMSY